MLTSRRIDSSWLLKVGLISTSTMGDPSLVTSMLVKPLEGASLLPPLPPTMLPCSPKISFTVYSASSGDQLSDIALSSLFRKDTLVIANLSALTASANGHILI